MLAFIIRMSLLAVFLLAGKIDAEINDAQRAFYAISSLCYYLEREIATPNKPKPSTYNDLTKNVSYKALWSKASLAKENDLVKKAESLWLRSHEKNAENKKHLLIEAQHVLTEIWQRANPYYVNNKKSNSKIHKKFLLTSSHKLYSVIHKIFIWDAIYRELNAFEDAGFETISKRPSGMRVARHDLLKNHLIKIYLSSEKDKSDWAWAVDRCIGVTSIRDLIRDKKFRYFSVPGKWLVPLVRTDESLDGNLSARTDPVLLLVKDMQLVPKDVSKQKWKESDSKRHIQELYCLLSHGFSSCCLAANIPYTKEGKYSCIDTEIPQRLLPLHHVGRYLSEDMAAYFNRLVATGGKGMPF